MDNKNGKPNNTPSLEFQQALSDLREELILFIIAEREKQGCQQAHWVGNCEPLTNENRITALSLF